MLRGRVIDECTPDEVHGNLAIEQAIFEATRSTSSPLTLRFWKDTSSVILGRNQNLAEEVDEQYCEAHGITIARRMSGGGAVYHDDGNLNISFFVARKNLVLCKTVEEINNFFTGLLIASLERAGVSDLNRHGSTMILFLGKKISGAAGHHDGKRILHHATLLLSANLERMRGCLRAGPGLETTPGGSHYYPVTNLPPFDVNTWKRELASLLGLSLSMELIPGKLSMDELASSRSLRDEIYATEAWIHQKQV
ncbi:MAG TPA: lipoate--protein ligase family protein [Candidatus Lokiarchaeia archaeon]|nr:lipoate--protein ligase family protein [Candidatus Lokiarchaeia archaeon]